MTTIAVAAHLQLLRCTTLAPNRERNPAPPGNVMPA